MLKLDSNYSDYTDETDENYPEGKAINASSSESVDGTPLLAEFMNDVNAAHIAMYEKAYGNRTGISGSADTQKSSQFADAISKYSDDKLNAHKAQRGLTDGVHGATSEAEAGQIASRDEFGNLKVGTAIEDEDAVNKATVESMIMAVSAAVTPVGFVYSQLPGQPSPLDMKLFGTWEELKFGGVFFRAEGGDALPFTEEFKCVTAGNSIALNADDADTLEYENLLSSYDVTKLIVIAGDENRSITAWDRSTHTITLDSAFSSSNITTVLIGQNAGLPNIEGKTQTHSDNISGFLGIDKEGKTQGAFYASDVSTNYLTGNAGKGFLLGFDASRSNPIYGNSDTVTTANLAIKYWKRIS